MNQEELYEHQVLRNGSEPSPQDALGRRETAIIRWIRSQIDSGENKTDFRIAELSVGDGQLSRGLVQEFPTSQVDCFDISPSRLQYCRQRAYALSDAATKRMRFIEANFDTEFHRLDRGAYDVVVAIDILEHVFDVFGFVRNCREILRPNGCLFLRVPNLTYFKRRFAVLFGHLPVTSSWFDTPGSMQSWKDHYGWDGGHLHFFTIDTLKWLVTAEGLHCEEWKDVGARAEGPRRLWPGMLFGNIALFARKMD